MLTQLLSNAFIQGHKGLFYFLQPSFLVFVFFSTVTLFQLLLIVFSVKKIIAQSSICHYIGLTYYFCFCNICHYKTKRLGQYKDFSISDKKTSPTMALKSHEEIILFMNQANQSLVQRIHLLALCPLNTSETTLVLPESTTPYPYLCNIIMKVKP